MEPFSSRFAKELKGEQRWDPRQPLCPPPVSPSTVPSSGRSRFLLPKEAARSPEPTPGKAPRDRYLERSGFITAIRQGQRFYLPVISAAVSS